MSRISALSGHMFFVASLLDWYKANKRSLPWRLKPDPFRVWLSEIILQQTRVEQGRPYYESFIKEFPDVNALARAPQDKVLRLWQGLGYYSRARNLHRCAREISERMAGKFPQTSEALVELPGIGPYTAAAIASICFDEFVPVVDGNVFRVLSRVFGIYDPIDTPAGKRTFTALANTLISVASGLSGTRAGDYNQAVMEFGALQCVPKSPDCGKCPLHSMCHARAQEAVSALPVKSKSTAKKIRHFHYLVVTDGRKTLLRQRTSKDIWNGLYDFPVLEGEIVDLKKPFRKLIRTAGSELTSKGRLIRQKDLGVSRHVLTHQEIEAHFHLFQIATIKPAVPVDRKSKNPSKGRMVTFAQAEKLPKPVIIARFMASLPSIIEENGLN